MATTLYYVQSDTLPQIKLTLTDEATELARNLTDKKVSIHCKPATGSGVRFSREAEFTSPADRIAGICYINWEDGDLNRAPGNYSAEIEIYDTVAQSRETIYDLITLTIREDIGDIAPVSGPTSNTTNPPIGPNPS
jgi:hypothetical protein